MGGNQLQSSLLTVRAFVGGGPRALASLALAGAVFLSIVSPARGAEPKAKPQKSESKDASKKSDMKLKGGEEGTLFKSLRIEGEDRIRIEFDRPALRLNVDPRSAPGLEWLSIREILDRSPEDRLAPMLRGSAFERSPYMPRPWLDGFTTGNVARFRPAVSGVDRWRLVIADSRGKAVQSFEGEGKMPEEIGWDGRSHDGAPVLPGLTYSYVLEAYDRAGNKRNFVGEGFQLPPYRIRDAKGLVMLFSGETLAGAADPPGFSIEGIASEANVPGPSMSASKASTPSILLEVATWLNQFEKTDAAVQVKVTARTSDHAKALAQRIVQALRPIVLGDPARIQAQTSIEPDAPDAGAVMIVVAE